MRKRTFKQDRSRTCGRRLLVVPVLLLLVLEAAAQESDTEKEKGQSHSWNAAYYVYPELNSGLPEPSRPVHLNTPQSALENFILSARDGNYERAAYSLNLTFMKEKEQGRKGAVLAEKLHYVLHKRIWIDWDDIPDRPDAADEFSPTNAKDNSPRRSIRIGEIDLDGRDIRIGLQRIKTPNQRPVWVFSRQTVENIEALYELYGPSMLYRVMPKALREWQIAGIILGHWIFMTAFLICGIFSGWLVQKMSYLYLRRKQVVKWSVRLARVTGLPIALLVATIVFYTLSFSLLDLSAPMFTILNPLLITLIILDVTWLGMRLINFGLDEAKHSYLMKQKTSLEEEGHTSARRIVTYFTIGRMVFLFFVFFVGIGFALSQFRLFKALGISLLASAGVASVIFGFAAHRVLGNVLAGIQIAITQPVRIEDTVNFEGDWSNVEEINYTHLVLRTWDQRRIVVPISYFMSHTIENWSASKPSLTKSIYLYVDYRMDVSVIREKFEELPRNSDRWDEVIEPIVQVTACKEETMEVRCLCSAKDAKTAWGLHCDLRETMIAWLQSYQNGLYLPRKRILHAPLENSPKTAEQNGEAEHKPSQKTAEGAGESEGAE